MSGFVCIVDKACLLSDLSQISDVSPSLYNNLTPRSQAALLAWRCGQGAGVAFERWEVLSWEERQNAFFIPKGPAMCLCLVAAFENFKPRLQQATGELREGEEIAAWRERRKEVKLSVRKKCASAITLSSRLLKKCRLDKS